LLNITYLYFIY